MVRITQGLPITVLAGLIEANGAEKPYITQIVLHDGRLLGSYRKNTIEDEEADWFAPGLYGEQATRNWRSGFEWWQGECRKYLSRWARRHGIWVAVATQAGRTVDEDFPGGGYVFAPDGQRLFATPDWSPGAAYLELDFERREVQVL